MIYHEVTQIKYLTKHINKPIYYSKLLWWILLISNETWCLHIDIIMK